MKKLFYVCGILISGCCFSQESASKVKAAFFNGVAVAGYVDHGGFINFTGPNVSITNKDIKFILGMLPSLRIKEDQSSGTKNNMITPNLGIGLTAVYRKIALQIPVYYNSKTAAENGAWKLGMGLGYFIK